MFIFVTVSVAPAFKRIGVLGVFVLGGNFVGSFGLPNGYVAVGYLNRARNVVNRPMDIVFSENGSIGSGINHFAGYFRRLNVPTCKFIIILYRTFLFGCAVVLREFAVFFHRARKYRAVFVAPSNKILILRCRIRCNVDNIILHARNCRCPTDKGIGIFCGCFSCRLIIVIGGNLAVFNVKVGFKNRSVPILPFNVILVYLPLCSYNNVFGRHLIGNVNVPSDEGVTRLGRISRCSYCSIVILSDRRQRTAAVGVKGDSVLVNSPQCLYSLVLSRHNSRNGIIPSDKSVTRLGGVSRRNNRRIVIARYSLNLSSSIGIKGNGVLIYSPQSIKNHTVQRHRFGEFNSSYSVNAPSCKGITFPHGIAGLIDRALVSGYDISHCVTAVSIKDYSVLVGSPNRLDRHIFGRH